MRALILAAIRLACRFHCRLHGCELGRGVLIHGLPRIRRKSGGRIIVGDGVTINTARWSNPLNDRRGSSLSVGPGAVIEIQAGAGLSTVQIAALVGVTIGPGSLIGAGCLICDSDLHEIPLGSDRPIQSAPIHIGRKVFIGARSVVLKGVTIGDGAVIAAASVVTRDVPPATLVAGCPARPVRR